jgi:hypothetical protein
VKEIMTSEIIKKSKLENLDDYNIGVLVKIETEFELEPNTYLFTYDEYGNISEKIYGFGDSNLSENEVSFVGVTSDDNMFSFINLLTLHLNENEEYSIQQIYENGELPFFLAVLYERVINDQNITTLH